jgi:GT2 family glycosyltransferase
MSKVYLIMVNYNGGQVVMDTIANLIQTPAGASYELVVVDNGSNDGSREAIKKVYRGVKVLETGVNLGFGKGNNFAFNYLAGLPKKPELVCLIQPDMAFTRDWLGDLVKYARLTPAAAAVGPLVVYSDKYVPVSITGAKGLFFHHADYRFSAQFSRGASHRDLSLGSLGGQMHFVECLYDKTMLLLPASEDQQYLTVYDESMRGFKITIGDLKYSSNKLIAFFRKVLYKLTGFAPLKMYILKLPEVDRDEAVEIVNSLGSGFIKGAKLPDHIGYGRTLASLKDEDLTSKEIPLFYGACALLRYSVIMDVGAFDEDYFMYYEESDLALRLREAGYEIHLEPSSVVLHKERGNRSTRSTEIIMEGQQVFLRKWGKKLTQSYIKQHRLGI